jgi:hypothetical protein
VFLHPVSIDRKRLVPFRCQPVRTILKYTDSNWTDSTPSFYLPDASVFPFPGLLL